MNGVTSREEIEDRLAREGAIWSNVDSLAMHQARQRSSVGEKLLDEHRLLLVRRCIQVAANQLDIDCREYGTLAALLDSILNKARSKPLNPSWYDVCWRLLQVTTGWETEITPKCHG